MCMCIDCLNLYRVFTFEPEYLGYNERDTYIPSGESERASQYVSDDGRIYVG